MAFIQIIEAEEADGRLLEIYDDLQRSRGRLAEVHKIQSLNPESIVKHMELYMTIMFGQSPLRRVLREMMAVVVSRANNCEYCQIHHAEAVLHYWKDAGKVEKLKSDYRTAGLTAEELLLSELAWELTVNAGSFDPETRLKPLREAGFSDRALLDATLVISYFNFVNRIVLGLGVQLEENPGGYNYDN